MVVRLEEVHRESGDTTTLTIPYKLNSKPGQFVMLWLPGKGEKPISISGEKEGKFQVSVCAVGPFSEAVSKLKKGDKIGFRGPFGTHFKIPKDSTSLAMVGGGYGSAPLSYLAEEATAQGKKVYFIEGARTKARLLFTERMKQAGAEVLLCTDDGSEGPKCYSPDVLKTVLETHKIDKVFTCGPEIMMKKVAELSKEAKIRCEVSMERYMKCGIGICGQCCVDDIGLCLCTNGPIIPGDLALEIKEFGSYHRDSTGKKV
ncbi:dihydroorotate dehydrogenase electron transfer subunit [Candidatus Micrarchaeota archaeon]|nr:dihydroorotate dehydrogenase electron transfer subunit [Candidatus Micrarchaeota archaeon]MBD3418427.1 dihydroorotate dehydrogenase electron transfer subunit [Candidatus Micrarchaeota archaeon]